MKFSLNELQKEVEAKSGVKLSLKKVTEGYY
jgi:hypothetical protein